MLTRVQAELHVCGADAVVIQTEGEVAAARRLRLWAVSAAPAGHVPWRCHDPEAAARRRRRSAGARGWGGEGVWRGGGGGGGGGRGERGLRVNGAKRTVFVIHVQHGGLARRDGHPGLPARGHRAGLDQLGSALVDLASVGHRGRIMSSVERRGRFEWKSLQRERKDTSSMLTVSQVPWKRDKARFTFEGPLNSWILTSISLIQPCISSGESVY